MARIHYELPLAGVALPSTVPLAPVGSACGDWRAQLQANWSQPQQVQLAGTYPASCGDKNWPVALPEPERFAAKAIEGMWRALGGQLNGHGARWPSAPGPKTSLGKTNRPPWPKWCAISINTATTS